MPTFYIEQFGCRATQADGAAIERQLREQGCQLAPHSYAADVVVLNTCTVTAAADTQARDAIRKLHAANPSTRIIVTGCYAQRAPEELAVLPGVSFVVGNSHKPQIPNLLHAIALMPPVGAQHAAPHLARLPHSGGLPDHAKILTGDIFVLSEVLVAPVLGGEGNHTRPTLKIQDGCNARCSFCVIPFVRGRSRSLPPEKVVAEVQQLAASGYREIVLSGINLGAYGRDLSPRVLFLDLLRRILDETPVERLRVSSIEPLDVSLPLIELIVSSQRLAPHFHMPLQSASNRILAAMHRWYRAEHYARRVELIHECLPHAAIGADVITGFPDETEADPSPTCMSSPIPSAPAQKRRLCPIRLLAVSSNAARANCAPSGKPNPPSFAPHKSAAPFVSSLYAAIPRTILPSRPQSPKIISLSSSRSHCRPINS